MRKTHPDTDNEHMETGVGGRWAWFVMLGCLLSHVVSGSITRSAGEFYLKFMDHFGQSAELTSWTVTINSTLMILLGPLASVLCNRFSVRTVVALGATLCTSGMLLSAFSTDMYFLSFTFGILYGFGIAFIYSPGLVILGQYFKHRPSLAGIATSGTPLSSCVFPTLIELMFHHYGFFSTFLILSIFVSNFYICAALYRPLDLHQRFVQQDRLKQRMKETCILQNESNTETNFGGTFSEIIVGQTTDEGNKDRASILETKLMRSQQLSNKLDVQQQKTKQMTLEVSLLRNLSFLCVCVQISLFSLSLHTIITYLPALTLEKGIDTLNATYLVSVMGICDALSRILASIILDIERIRPFRLVIYNANIFAIAACTLAMPFMLSLWQFCVVSGLYGITNGIYVSQMSVVCMDVFGVEHLTSSFGLLLAFEGVGAVVSPTIGGLVKDYLGRYDDAFYVASAGTTVGGVVMAVGIVLLYRRNDNAYQSF